MGGLSPVKGIGKTDWEKTQSRDDETRRAHRDPINARNTNIGRTNLVHAKVTREFIRNSELVETVNDVMSRVVKKGTRVASDLSKCDGGNRGNPGGLF